ncbi:MAG: hypothetical protein V4668_03465 [Patescibacteria group bacterium]
MSYQTYITEGLICGSFDSNTADKSYLLFTKSAGMIYASARSVREERSRQRFALQDFGIVTVSLIKGKTGWRIGSVQSEGNLFASAPNRLVRGSVVRMFKFLRRFAGAEEPEPVIYDEFCLGLSYLTKPDVENRTLIEEVLQARMLYHLGYIADTEDINFIFEQPLPVVITSELLLPLLPRLKTITGNATTASHL